MTVHIRAMTAADAPAVLAIYGDGVATGHATFQDRVPAWTDWDKAHLAPCRLVAVDDGTVAGFAALSGVSARPVYRGVAEVSVYVAGPARRRGLGRVLLEALIEAAEAAGLWTLQAGIFPENLASLKLHRECGFREVGRRERLGRMSHGPLAGQWRDVILMERRSTIAGTV
jgi:L-amino acid N-acyltransferase YncA